MGAKVYHLVASIIPITIILVTLANIPLFTKEPKSAEEQGYNANAYILIAQSSKPNNEDWQFVSKRKRSSHQLAKSPALLSGSQGTGLIDVKVGDHVKLPNNREYYAISGISIHELNNKPCYVKLYGSLIDPRYQSPSRLVAKYIFDRCGPRIKLARVPDKQWIEFNDHDEPFDYQKRTKLFLNRIQVCSGNGLVNPQKSSGASGKIKGLRARAAEVSIIDSAVLNGTAKDHSDRESHTKTNCSQKLKAETGEPNWGIEKGCPTGQIATGIKIYHHENRYATDIDLICKRILSKKLDNPPYLDELGY